MTSKINVTENIAILIEKRAITVNTTLNFDMSINFDNKEKEPTLDENGDIFEPVYKCKIKDLQEIKKFFEFVRENKENLFEMAGFRGALE